MKPTPEWLEKWVERWENETGEIEDFLTAIYAEVYAKARREHGGMTTLLAYDKGKEDGRRETLK